MTSPSPAQSSEHGTLPLAPVEQPRGLFLRLIYWVTRKRYGLTPTAFRVLYARSPWLALVSLVIGIGLEKMVRIDNQLRLLLQITVSTQNGCTFCADLYLAEALRARLGRERFRDLAEFESSSSFSAREKAALGYASALNRSLHVPDAVWSRLEQHFSERERVDIVWTCAVERYFNSMALPLRIGSDHISDNMLGAGVPAVEAHAAARERS